MSAIKENNVQTFINYFRSFSITMTAALELLGYSYSQIKHRQEHFTGFTFNGVWGFSVGSRAEGISKCVESDHDFMIQINNCNCADDIGDKDSSNPALFLLTEMDNLNPGYSKLKVALPDDLQNLPDTDDVSQLCFKQGGVVYVSSTHYRKIIPKFEGRGMLSDISGPAISTTCLLFPCSGDTVYAIPYACRILSQEWLARPRFHGWPSQETLQQLSKLDWHLVPVGPQENSFLEWRICFTLGELYLVKTFNITQLHLLILLKLVMNKSLKPLCSAFSSYTAKNLVFWMVEILAPENFKVENLSFLLMMSLQMMRTAVENEQLKNYMIPSRNLLKGKMSRDEKDKIMKVLDGFIDYGPSFLVTQSEYSELKKAMQKVDNDTDRAQQLHRHSIIEKHAYDFKMAVLNELNFEDMNKMLTSVVSGCSLRDVLMGDEKTMKGLRNLFKGPALELFLDLLNRIARFSKEK